MSKMAFDRAASNSPSPALWEGEGPLTASFVRNHALTRQEFGGH
jgi:hypothetical protein